MRQTTTTVMTSAAAMTTDSRRALVRLAVLPLSLLLMAAGVLPLLGQQHPQVTRSAEARTPAGWKPAEDHTPPELCVQQKHREIALDTMDRLEKEVRQGKGAAQISALDLRRLRNALRLAE